MFPNRLSLAAILVSLFGAAHGQGGAAEPTVVDVFVPDARYPSVRIPSIVVTGDGTLLALAEGRNFNRDHAANDIVLRRSTDGGRTWGKLMVVAEDGEHSLNNPQAVVVPESGRVLLMYQRFPQSVHERKVAAGHDGPNICRNFLTYSDDQGQTWSKPQDVTASTKRPDGATSIAGGPGVGIVLSRGEHRERIVMPFNEGPFGRWKVYAVLSDDGGKTWTYGETAPDGDKGTANEVQMVELADGAVMLNSRSQGGNRVRKIALSRDGGQSWTKLKDDPQLPDPQCQGSILRYDWPAGDRPGRLLFVNPANPRGRSLGTVRLSIDDGKTWPVERVLCQGSFAYSCLTALPDGTIGCLYEADGMKKIVFARFTLDWLTGVKDTLEKKGKQQ